MNRKESATRPAVKHMGEHTGLWPEPVPGVPTSGVQSAPSGPSFPQVHVEVVG